MSADRLKNWSKLLVGGSSRHGAAIALALLVLANMLWTPHFATTANLWNILLQVSTTVLIAIGMTFVIATSGIDLSVGSVMSLCAVIAATLLPSGTGQAILWALVAALGVGLVQGGLIAGFGIPPILVTLASLIIVRGAAQVMSEGTPLIAFSNPSFEWLGKGLVGPVPVQVLAMILCLALSFFAIRATRFGRYVVAVGGNEAASRLVGIRVGWIKVAVYVISALLAGLAGLIETARLSASDASLGQGAELDAIAAAVVGGNPLSGGRAQMIGTWVGALIMAVITTSFNMRLIPYAWSLVFKAAILLVAVWIQRANQA